MKKIKKKRIFIAIILLVLMIIEIIAFNDSKSRNAININATVIDSEGKLGNMTTQVEAVDAGEAGYYIDLPDFVDGKYVEKYIVTTTMMQNTTKTVENPLQNEITNETENTIEGNIINNTNVNEINNTENTTQEITVQEEVTTESALLPGERVFITDQEKNTKTMTLTAKYKTTQKDNELLYYKKVQASIDNTGVTIEGFMPLNANVKVKYAEEEPITEVAEEYLTGQIRISQALDVTLMVDDKEYEPTDFDENVKVVFSGVEETESRFRVLHIKENNEVEEIPNVEKSGNEITFTTNSFSTYALLVDDSEMTELDLSTYALYAANLDEADVWDGTVATEFKFGQGTESNPYLIKDAKELAYLAQKVNNGTTYEGNYFKLIRDIDLNQKVWTPIGDEDSNFRGSLDGQGHIISNAVIQTATGTPSDYYAYGIFGSVGGGSNTSLIKNLEIDTVSIEMRFSGNFNSTNGIAIGVLTGKLYRNGEIRNCIVKNSVISDLESLVIRTENAQIFVGGMVGMISNTSGSESNPGNGNYSAIENCYVDVDIDLDVTLRSSSRRYASQYAAGGIVGAIRSQPVWPESSLYVGTINATNAFTGPIFAYLRESTSIPSSSSTRFNTVWNGNDAGDLTMSSYYSEYYTNNSRFTSTFTSGTVSTSTTYRRSTSTSSIGYVQGMNKGIYLSDKSAMLTNFNSYGSTDEYTTWLYENGTYTFLKRMSSTIDDSLMPTYTIDVVNNYNPTSTFTYEWYVNDVLDTSITGATISKEPTWETGYNIEALVKDENNNYLLVGFEIPAYEVHVEFTVNSSNGTIDTTITGTGVAYIDLADYTYQWYEVDISGMEETEIVGATGSTLTGAVATTDYKVIATNGKNEYMSAEGTVTYGNRIAVFVDNENGSDSNDGFTPETPVKNMPMAYSKLSQTGDRTENVIIIMGYYSDDDYIHNDSTTNKNNYSKNATLTGVYHGIDYNARLYFDGDPDSNSGRGGRLICADTTFQYLTFEGSRTYLYCKGHSLTIGEKIYQVGYNTTQNTNAMVDNSPSPDFHILGGFPNLTTTDLEARGGTILIKSGCFARVIAGSRNTQVNSSNNTTATADNPYSMKVICDIENSTKQSWPYDINLMVAGQTDGNIFANMELTIKNGTIGKITGGSIGYSRQISNYPSNSYFGSTKITVEGGSIKELFGGSLGRLKSDVYYYGKIDINVTGGTINDNLYGVGAGGVTGYNANSSDPYKSMGKAYETSININISGGTINGNIYGAGYGYSSYLDSSQIATDGGTLYGDSTINITGGTIDGNIYGAGRGYSGYSGKTTLAQMYGNSTINISQSPTINGIVYGAGEGIRNYNETAKLIGTSNININTSLNINIYGGGNIARTQGTTNVNINSGNQTADIFGGGNLGLVEGTTNVNINGGTTGDVYGGGKSASVTTANVYLKGGSSSNVYGGGQSADATTTNVYLQGGTATIIYGGSNTSGTVIESNVTTTSGTADTIYGGNNAGGTTTTSNVYGRGGIIQTAVYGGGNEVETGTTNMTLESFEEVLSLAIGGGNRAGATTTNVNLNGATVTDTFGGSNILGNVSESNVNINSGKLTNVYGGNNQGGTTETTRVNANGGNTEYVYGGGNQAKTTTSYVEINKGTIINAFGGGNQAETTNTNVYTNGGNITNVFGGGNEAGAITTNVNLYDGTIENAYGGANASGTINTSNIQTIENQDTAKVKISYDYTTRNTNSWESTEYATYVEGTVTLTNTTNTAINKYDASITILDSTINENYTVKITDVNDKYTFNQDNMWYGVNTIPANGTFTFDVSFYTNQQADSVVVNTSIKAYNSDNSVINNTDLKVTQLFGGNNAGGTTEESNVITGAGTIQNVYGGNNQDGQTITSNVTVNSGTITDVYGGGEKAVTNITNVQINGEVQNCVYGGGNQAGVNTNTNVNLNRATVLNNVYGGGNEGTVTGSTYVHVYDSELGSSLYAGGNGVTAIVYRNTNLIMDGTTNSVAENVFGGGNQAETGTSLYNNSTSTVNIVNGKIGRNVYGGANTSVVYGIANVKIGYDAVADTGLTIGDVQIAGTVFGGGEANASGSEVYDFSFISVTNGINIDIDGNGHSSFYIKGSIFGSGNASSTSGASYVNLKNYGSFDAPQSNISIQRATLATLDNSAIALSGATDRTNEYSSTYFTLSRVDELKLKNNSCVYLNYGANLLRKLSSVVDENGTEIKATVAINPDTGETIRNVDNRIYMAEGKNLNIATNEQVTAYGEVSGMTFFGLFTNTMNPATSTGLYHHGYNNGDDVTNTGTFTSNSYVIGQHMPNHNTETDGFYSNYDEDGKIKTKYIETTPEDDVYYMWFIGEDVDVTVFEISLTASKYATLGTYELGLTGFATPNIKFNLTGFSAGLASDVSLIDPNQIESVASNESDANTKFGLSMRTGNNGWQTKSSTTFLTANGGSYTGASSYGSDNSSATPALNFCLYHSENLTEKRDLGAVKIRLQVLTPIDDLNYYLSYIDINVTLSSALYQNDFFEAAITPGEEFGLFTTTETNITDKSVFSTYYSLYIEDFSTSDYYAQYSTYKNVLVSRDANNLPYVLPEGTKLTMIDAITNKYYYYIVSAQDVAANKYVYNLTDFIAMGSEDKMYDKNTEYTEHYYNSSQDLIYQNFIFHIAFDETNLDENIVNNRLLMELRDQDEQILIGVLGIQRDPMVYSVYKDTKSTINVSVASSESTVYLGNKFTLTVTTDYQQNIVDSKTIFDTQYFDEKMGVKISIIDNNGNQLNSDSLLGINFTLDGVTYYPRIDGTIRICTAEKVSNILSRIQIDTRNNTVLATGTYTIRVESFGSPDGIYYGTTSSDTDEVRVTIINSAYGLKVSTSDKSKIIDAETGNTLFGSNSMTVNVEYSSGLDNPNIRMKLYRRVYDEIYSQNYELVDLKDYVINTLTQTLNTKQYYYVESNPGSSMKHFLYFKNNLLTGTYKLTYELYDGNSYIGEAYEYIVIK